MSHSKKNKRGSSFYINNWNPSAKRFINTCAICGAQGYSPTIDDEGFVYNEARSVTDHEHMAIRSELRSILKPLALDELLRCEDCARVMENKQENK